jgi:hypothetical protein
MQNELSPLLTLHRCKNPDTACEYPLLAVADERAGLLYLGDHRVAFTSTIQEAASGWLARDFAPTGEILQFDLAGIRADVAQALSGRLVAFRVTYDASLSPVALNLTLRLADADADADADGEEDSDLGYIIEGFGSYVRLDGSGDSGQPVTLPERSMLDGCVAIFAELAARYAELLRTPRPQPPRPTSAPHPGRSV